MKRRIIKINEKKCNGCAKCVGICAEAAIEIVDGKAKVVSDFLCDGMGACLDVCPVGALEIIEKDTSQYSPNKAYERVYNLRGAEAAKNVHGIKKDNNIKNKIGTSCPGIMSKNISHKKSNKESSSVNVASELRNWPVQLKLLNLDAPYLDSANLVISADCAPFSFSNFHKKFLENKILVILCPKLDGDQKMYVEKLAYIFENKNIKSITIVHMEVPCCFGIEHIVTEALKKSHKNIIIKEYCISLNGEVV